MTRDDIIRMAREAGMEQEGLMFYSPYDDEFDVHIDHLEAFTKLVAAAEREACAKVAEERFLDKANCTAEEMYELQKKSIAAAIRERG